MNRKQITRTLALSVASASIVVFSSCVNPIGVPAPLQKPAAIPSNVIPTAKPVLDANGQARKDLYISPYSPFNPIDTRGYSSGDIVGDPSTAKVSKKTGKPILSTSRGFKLP